MDFDGAKVALFIGARLLIIQRDDRADIPYPGLWEFPGGGREGAETPFETMAREVREEVGLAVPEEAVVWRRRFAAAHDPRLDVWMFVARLPVRAAGHVVFGNEGQGWRLAPVQEVLAMPDMIAHLQDRLRIWLGEAPL